MKKIFVFALLATFGLLMPMQEAMAQFDHRRRTEDKKALKYFEEARVNLRQRQFEEGIKNLEKSINRDPNFVDAQYTLGVVYLSLREKTKARPYLEKTVALAPEHPSFTGALYSLGNLQYENGEYGAALQHMRSYVESMSANPKTVQEANHQIANCEFALEAMREPLDINPQLLADTANSFQYQYFPSLTADGKQLFFTVRSDRDPEDIYMSERVEGGGWTEPKKLSDKINSERENEGTCSVSGDGKTLVFTACERPGGVGRCDLYISKKVGGEWSAPKNIGKPVNSEAWESQPSLSADGRSLYFTSDRRGGYGKRDIYVSFLDEKDHWGNATNLGPSVNTTYDEVSPFIHVNGHALYFSSDGHKGFGGFDLFYVQGSDSVFGTPVNIGHPLNSEKDEVSFFVNTEGTEAYYSIDLNKGDRGEMSRSYLYKVELPEVFVHNREMSNVLKGSVYDNETKKPMRAKLELVDLKLDKKVQMVYSDSADGDYMAVLTEGAKYGLFVDKPGYLFKSVNFDYQEVGDQKTVLLDVYMDPIRSGAKVTLANVFFDTDKYELKPESKTELEKLITFMEQNPTVSIEVSGHTDDVGSKDYNKALSDNRAKSVKEYLAKNGVAASRLKHKGYGMEKPAVANDTDDNRQKNRRIEFMIL